MHQFDGQEDNERPWLPCTASWCANFADRFSSLLFSKAVPHLYSETAGGLIFRPSQVNIFCAWSADAGSMTLTCNPLGPSETCLPGCWRNAPNWCTRNTFWECCYPPQRLEQMLRTQLNGASADRYNEVIVDARRYSHRLPNSLEAIMTQTRNDQTIRTAHARFLTENGLTAADVPLVLLRRDDTEAPFVDISGD